MYRFAEYENDPSLPAEAAEVPTEEGFSLAKTVHEGVILGKLLVVKEIKHLLEWNNSWKSLQDLQSVYTSVDQIFHLPPGAGTWFKDRHFGYQRVNGLNHSFIERCEQIPQKLPVTDSMLKDHLDGLTIQQAIDSKRLFIVDLELLTGIPTQKGRILCAPIGLFFSKNQDELLPVAIQLFQKPGPNNPVFLPEPEDSMRWRLVKMWFNNADAAYHQSVAHLGMTHLLMEGVVVTTHRQLSAKHPIFKLLAPHFLYNIQVNDHAKTTLLGKKGYVTTSMTAGADGTMELTRRALKLWRMDLHGTLPEDLKRRGLEDPDVLPSYHFRDDALLLYNAILKYVTEYTALYYESPDILKTDIQIQAWAAELVKPRNNQDGGCGLQGVPGNGRLDTIDQLVTILTSVIFTCSVQHASVNFAQYDEYGFPVNYPAILYGQPPSSTGDEISEKDILSALPKPFQTLDIMVITSLLSDKYDNKLGYFEHNYITAEDAGSERPLACVVAFKGELQKIQQVMEGRNKERLQPYNNLYPEYVPNAISI